MFITNVGVQLEDGLQYTVRSRLTCDEHSGVGEHVDLVKVHLSGRVVRVRHFGMESTVVLGKQILTFGKLLGQREVLSFPLTKSFRDVRLDVVTLGAYDAVPRPYHQLVAAQLFRHGQVDGGDVPQRVVTR